MTYPRLLNLTTSKQILSGETVPLNAPFEGTAMALYLRSLTRYYSTWGWLTSLSVSGHSKNGVFSEY
jgi:hypothetical protein